jgi:hypothetical protein
MHEHTDEVIVNYTCTAGISLLGTTLAIGVYKSSPICLFLACFGRFRLTLPLCAGYTFPAHACRATQSQHGGDSHDSFRLGRNGVRCRRACRHPDADGRAAAGRPEPSAGARGGAGAGGDALAWARGGCLRADECLPCADDFGRRLWRGVDCATAAGVERRSTRPRRAQPRTLPTPSSRGAARAQRVADPDCRSVRRRLRLRSAAWKPSRSS